MSIIEQERNRAPRPSVDFARCLLSNCIPHLLANHTRRPSSKRVLFGPTSRLAVGCLVVGDPGARLERDTVDIREELFCHESVVLRTQGKLEIS
jgi:hypothetical protein